MYRQLLALVACFTVWSPAVAPAQDALPIFDVAVVSDGVSLPGTQLVSLLKNELSILTADEFEVRFKEDPSYTANFNPARVGQNLQAAFDDPEVDIVLVLGVLTTRAILRGDRVLPKPVLCGFVLDAEVFGLPYNEEGRSAKTNFTYVVTTGRSRNDLAAFKDLVDFKTLHVLVDQSLYEGVDFFEKKDPARDALRGFAVQHVVMADRAEPVLAQLGDAVEAAYMTPAVQMAASEWQALIDGVNARGIPSFALRGVVDVERGVLAGLLPHIEQQLARRVALNLQQIMLGTPPEELPVFLSVEEQLTINAQTAKAIGYAPARELLERAEVLHPEAFAAAGEPLSLEQAMTMAAENNVDLAIKQAEVRAASEQRRLTRSVLLPQALGNAGYTQVDNDRAERSFSALPETQADVGVSLTQLLYDDEAVSSFRAAGRELERQRFDRESVRLDVMATAAIRYLEFLQQRALWSIEADNLKLTRSNLELARIRNKVGTSGPEDVYRWESQEAEGRSGVLAARARADQSRVRLNQTLGVEANAAWNPQDIEMADDEFYFMDDTKLTEFISKQQDLDLFRGYSVLTALGNAPELKALDKAIEAQELVLAQRKRTYFMPRLFAQFDYRHYLDREFAGAGTLPGGGSAGDPEDEVWTFAVAANLPVFEGGGRAHEVNRVEAGLNQLRETRERVRQLTEQQVLAATYAVEASHPAIELSRLAADRAGKNLRIVRDKYARGAASIIDLLDAQSEAFRQDQRAVIAVYTYLQDLIDYERAISWFDKFATGEERAAWIQGFGDFLEERR